MTSSSTFPSLPSSSPAPGRNSESATGSAAAPPSEGGISFEGLLPRTQGRSAPQTAQTETPPQSDSSEQGSSAPNNPSALPTEATLSAASPSVVSLPAGLGEHTEEAQSGEEVSSEERLEVAKKGETTKGGNQYRVPNSRTVPDSTGGFSTQVRVPVGDGAVRSDGHSSSIHGSAPALARETEQPSAPSRLSGSAMKPSDAQTSPHPDRMTIGLIAKEPAKTGSSETRVGNEPTSFSSSGESSNRNRIPANAAFTPSKQGDAMLAEPSGHGNVPTGSTVQPKPKERLTARDGAPAGSIPISVPPRAFGTSDVESRDIPNERVAQSKDSSVEKSTAFSPMRPEGENGRLPASPPGQTSGSVPTSTAPAPRQETPTVSSLVPKDSNPVQAQPSENVPPIDSKLTNGSGPSARPDSTVQLEKTVVHPSENRATLDSTNRLPKSTDLVRSSARAPISETPVAVTPERPAENAASVDAAPSVALEGRSRIQNNLLLSIYNKHLKKSLGLVGIKDASELGAMPSLLAGPLLKSEAITPVANVDAVLSQLPTEWVDKLSSLTAQARRLAPAKLEVELPLQNGESLRVRMSYSHGSLRSEFQTGDAELQRMFVREWPSLAQVFHREGPGQLRIEPPVFQTPSGRDAAADQHSSRQREQREDDPSENAEDAAVLFGARREFAHLQPQTNRPPVTRHASQS